MKKFLYCILISNVINCGYNCVNASDLILFFDETNSGNKNHTYHGEIVCDNNCITNNKTIYEHDSENIGNVQLKKNNANDLMRFMKETNSLNDYTLKKSNYKSQYENTIPIIGNNATELINFMKVTNSYGKSNHKSIYVNKHEYKHEFMKSIHNINTSNDLLNFFMETNSQGNIPSRPVHSHHECESDRINQHKPENASNLIYFFRVTNSLENIIIQENIQTDTVNEQKFEDKIKQEESTANDLIKFFIETNSLGDKYTTNNFEVIREYKPEEIIPYKRNTANDLIKFYRLTNSCDNRKYSGNSTDDNNQDDDNQDDNNHSVLRSTCENNTMNILLDAQLRNNRSNTNENNQDNNQSVLRNTDNTNTVNIFQNIQLQNNENNNSNNNQDNNSQFVLRSTDNKNSVEISQKKVRLLGKKKILGKIKNIEENNTINSSPIQNNLKNEILRIDNPLQQEEKKLQENNNEQRINNFLQNMQIQCNVQNELPKTKPIQEKTEKKLQYTEDLSRVNSISLQQSVHVNQQQIHNLIREKNPNVSQVEGRQLQGNQKQLGNTNISQVEDKQLQDKNQLLSIENQNTFTIKCKSIQVNQLLENNEELMDDYSQNIQTQNNTHTEALRALNPLKRISQMSNDNDQVTSSLPQNISVQNNPQTVLRNAVNLLKKVSSLQENNVKTNSNENTSFGNKINIDSLDINNECNSYNSNNKQSINNSHNNNQPNNKDIINDSILEHDNNNTEKNLNNDYHIDNTLQHWSNSDLTLKPIILPDNTNNISTLSNNDIEHLTNNVSDITMPSKVISGYSSSKNFNYSMNDSIKTICTSTIENIVKESINKKQIPENISKLITDKVINKVISELSGKNINEIDKRIIEKITKRILNKISQELIQKMNDEIKSQINKMYELKNTTLNRIENKEISESDGQKIIDDELSQILNKIPSIKQFQDTILEVANELKGEIQNIQKLKNNITSNINYENFTPVRMR